MQLVWRRKPRDTIYVRAAPSTLRHPKAAQLERRLAFAEAARKATGKRGLCPCHGLPWAAHHVLEELKGTEAPRELRAAREPEWLKRLRELREALALARRLAEAAPRAS